MGVGFYDLGGGGLGAIFGQGVAHAGVAVVGVGGLFYA